MPHKISEIRKKGLPTNLKTISDNFTPEQLTAMQGVPANIYTTIQGGVSTGGGGSTVSTIQLVFTSDKETQSVTLNPPIANTSTANIIGSIDVGNGVWKPTDKLSFEFYSLSSVIITADVAGTYKVSYVS